MVVAVLEYYRCHVTSAYLKTAELACQPLSNIITRPTMSGCSPYLATERLNLVAGQPHMLRDGPNSRFHGRDMFREIGRLP